MRKALGDPWYWFTVTASDQVHVDIAEPELLRVINVSSVCMKLNGHDLSTL